jgi:2-succinyl-5-enolpyruvyl-6-hydroxy-3-cyclohexene-1-carboxylate synthase
MNPPDVQAAFCAVLVDEWARAGVTDAVIAPGSRSTPLVLALDANARIRVHVVLDERSAGFLALGIGLASGRPAVVATTSGTAAVELHPAVVEAHQAGVPLIAATSDRPPELHGVGAPQTVVQEALFGPALRWSVSPGVADAGSSGSWRSLASRMVAESLSGPAGPGPVHVNLAFREPLLGDASAVGLPAGRADGAPWHRAQLRGDLDASVETVSLLASLSGRKGIVVAGAGCGDPCAVVEAAGSLGWPVLADPRSGCRRFNGSVIASADALLRVALVAGWTPDVVVRAGAPWASKVLSQWLASLPADVHQVLADPWSRWADPQRCASLVEATSGSALLRQVAAEAEPAGGTAWVHQWSEAEAAAQAVFDSLLAAGGELELSEPAVARALAGAMPPASTLIVSSSMPVRDVEWFGPLSQRPDVLSNRGANGIDGVVSTAVGAAVSGGGPVAALLGDLAFLYDASALLWAAGRDISLTVVVVDNGGGGIFSFLPQAAALPSQRFERYWGTPHRLDLAAVAAAYGAAARSVESRADLDAVVSAVGKPGVSVAVVRSDRATNVTVHERLNTAVAGAVSGMCGRPTV